MSCCRWYAICGATQSKSSQLPDCKGGLYRSEDSGATWQRIFDGGPVRNPVPLCSASKAPADALGSDSVSPAEDYLSQPHAPRETPFSALVTELMRLGTTGRRAIC